MEAVTFEEYYVAETTPVTKWADEIYVRDILFDTATGVSALYGGTLSYPLGPNAWDLGYGYPMISSENQVMTVADSSEIPLFVTVMMSQTGAGPANRVFGILESIWDVSGTPAWVSANQPPYKTTPQMYSWIGDDPNGSASTGRQETRYGVLYGTRPDSVLRTSREHFAKAKPGGYMAVGREINARVDDSLSLGIGARLFDVWASDDSTAMTLGMVPASAPDSLSDLLATMQTESFATSDSVRIGCMARVAYFVGDSSGAAMTTIDCLVELVDSSTGSVIAVLDSTRLDPANRLYGLRIDTTLDLLSATMYVRLRLSSTILPAGLTFDDSTTTWHIVKPAAWVGATASKHARRPGPTTGTGLRLSAQPNPMSDRTEIRFSIGRVEDVTITVLDGSGREVARLLDKVRYEAGRYAVELDAGQLPSGSYLIRLQAGEEQLVERVLLRR